MKCWYGLWLLALSTAVLAEEVAKVEEPDALFSNESYRLGYKVYLQRGNLSAAFSVATKAIRYQPDDPEWLKSYAQAAEWVGQPSEALESWLKLARQTNDAQAWDAVARLAPSLLDDEALLAYQQNILASQPDNAKVIQQISQTYERLGQVSAGLAFLAQLGRQHASQALSETEATLAERSGAYAHAKHVLTLLIERYSPQEVWVLRRASIHYALGELDLAWMGLKALEAEMPVTAVGFWQVYAELSRITGHPDDAANAYKVLVDNHGARASDLRNYINILQNKDGKAAAIISALLFSQSHEERDLITTLFLYQRENDLAAADRLLESLTPEQLADAERIPAFLEQRGRIYWKEKKYTLARADFKKAIHFTPSNLRLLQGLVGIVIDENDPVALAVILTNFESVAKKQPQLWSLWANGWNSVSQPQKALPFLKAYSKANPDDDLVLLELAETYVNLHNTRAALAIRKRVLAHQNTPKTTIEARNQAVIVEDALLALKLSEMSPEHGLSTLRQRLRQNKGVLDQKSRELILIWLLTHESEEKANHWIQQTYHDDAPIWAVTNIALNQNDHTALQQTLNTAPEQLPHYDRIRIASAEGQFAQAESLAFSAVENYPDDDEQYRNYQELMIKRGDWAEFVMGTERQGILHRQERAVVWDAQIQASWRLRLKAQHFDQRSHDVSKLLSPTNNDDLALQLTQELARTTWSFGANHRHAFRDLVGANISQEYTQNPSVILQWRADYNTEAAESVALLTMGIKDQLAANLHWAATRQNYVGVELLASHFYGQTRQSLGHGQMLNLEVGHHLFMDAARQSLRVRLTTAQFDADNQQLAPELEAAIPSLQVRSSQFFMPESYNQIRFYWSLGESNPNTYSAVWRYFAELDASYANTTGRGYGLRLGLYGSVLGNDRLNIGVEQTQGGQNNGDQSKRATLTYQYFY